jgi:two-component system OmpR family sensor kinase
MRWMRGLSIRTRITIGTLVIALVVSAVAGLLLQLRVEAIVHETTVQLLEADSAPFEAAIRKTPIDPQLAVGEGQLVAVLGPNGKTVLSNLPDSLRDVYAKLKTFHRSPRSVSNDGKQYLVTNERVRTDLGNWHVIVARSLEPGDLVLSQLSITLIVGAVALFVIFGIASWILSGAALRPVSRMRRQAELLDREEHLSGESLPVGPARDELAALATTLNDFLARNRLTMDRERQMISDASHELRTPLAILSAQLDEAAAAASHSEDAHPLVDKARDTARRLSRLATNLLELSQLEANTGTSSSSWSQLSLETAAAIDRARILGQPRGVIVDFDIADSVDAGLYPVAVSSFGRLIDNLLANAITASADGSTVSLDLGQSPTRLALTVTDQGRGMPEDFLPVAFDRFTRPDDARQRGGGGSGLGLAIVAAIVSASGGTIELRNALPGFVVSVRLPRTD